jgi:hypothetical protein
VDDIMGRVNGPKRLKLADRKAATARAWKVLSRSVRCKPCWWRSG